MKDVNYLILPGWPESLVEASDYDALAAELAEAKKLLRIWSRGIDLECRECWQWEHAQHAHDCRVGKLLGQPLQPAEGEP